MEEVTYDEVKFVDGMSIQGKLTVGLIQRLDKMDESEIQQLREIFVKQGLKKEIKKLLYIAIKVVTN